MAYKPISDYGIIGNMLSAALVGIDASIDWCCLPRFDSPSVFAAILDDERGGRFHIRPRAPSAPPQQAYLPDTNVLQTTFRTDTGVAAVTDFMPCYRNARGRLVQPNEIHRLVECREGQVALEAIFEPRPDYARGHAQLVSSKHGVGARNGPQTLALSSTVPLAIQGEKATSRFDLNRGEKAGFVLFHGTSQPLSIGKHRSLDKLKRTTDYWQSQARGCLYSGPWREAIVRSYLALHLLIYAPTGALLAAATASLPEEIGGERNWDYRFTWLRDASLTLNAFFQLQHLEEAVGFMNWLMTVCGRCGAKAQILYDIDFEHPLDEQQLAHLRGYRDSRPVRIGNDAYRQMQLDVFGEVLETVHAYTTFGGHISRQAWETLESFVNAACENWHRPDNGIWEVRGGPYHFVYSKVMCWVAADRGVKIAEKLGYSGDIESWRSAAEQIRADVLARGWNPQRQAFTQHYDTEALDASNLLLPLLGFLPFTDQRIVSTIENTVAELGWDGLMRRYRTEETDDGLSGSEGAFLICSFWLARNLIWLGRVEEARALYERLLGYGSHLGLYSEMADPASGEALGNFPQAFTHLAVIVTGLELARAVEEQKRQ